MLHSQENEDVSVSEFENNSLSDLPKEKCNETEVPAESCETFDGENFC